MIHVGIRASGVPSGSFHAKASPQKSSEPVICRSMQPADEDPGCRCFACQSKVQSFRCGLGVVVGAA